MYGSEDIFFHETEAMKGFLDKILPDGDKSCYVRDFQPYQFRDKTLLRCMVVQVNGATKNPVTKMLFDVNVLDNDFPTVYIEKEKIAIFKQYIDPNLPTRILSAHILHRKTLLFDILKLEKEGRMIDVEESFYVDITDAKSFEYGYRREMHPPPTEDPEMALDGELPSEAVDDFEAFLNEPESPKIDPGPSIYSEPAEKGEINKVDKRLLSEALAIASLKPEGAENNQSPVQVELFREGTYERRGIKRDASGKVIYNTAQEYNELPHDVKWEIAYLSLIEQDLRKGEDKDEMIKKYGSIEALYNFMWERARIEFLGLDIENKYEIK